MSIETWKGVEWVNIVGRGPIRVEDGPTNAVLLDCRGCVRMTVYLDGGTATYRAATADGTKVPGSSAESFDSGVAVDVDWPFYWITATTEPCWVATV